MSLTYPTHMIRDLSSALVPKYQTFLTFLPKYKIFLSIQYNEGKIIPENLNFESIILII